MSMKYTYDSIDAKGEVKFLKGAYGPEVYVNGKDLFGIDLFHLAAGGNSHPDSPFVQIVITDPLNEDRNVLIVRWLKDGQLEVVIQADAENVNVVHRDGI